MSTKRLDQKMLELGITKTRSQAENFIKLGYVSVDGKVINKSGFFVKENSKIKLKKITSFVGKGGLKLESANKKFKVAFKNKVVLDVGSSTGGFTDYALQNGAKKVIAVDVGTDQMHPSLLSNSKLELHEKTDIRNFKPNETPDIVVIDVSFISLRQILPQVAKISSKDTQIIAMVKPQFEAEKGQINRGVVKNDTKRREILKNFENWAKTLFKILDKADSEVAGGKGNVERFYLLSNYTKK